MAWETRGNGGSYYYRKVREGGRVVSIYASRMRSGHIAERLDRIEREDRRRQRAVLQHFIDEQRQVDRAIDNYRRQVRTFVTGVLEAAGCHRHKGQWRVRRGGTVNEIERANLNTYLAEADEYGRLYKSAIDSYRGSPENVKLREYVEGHPNMFLVLRSTHDNLIQQVVESASGQQAMQTQLAGEVRFFQKQLRGSNPTPLEELLVKDVALCWLRLLIVESIYTRDFDEGLSFAKAAYLENRLSATRRRYMQAVEGLARVRQLQARVPVQFNVAQQMVVQN